jgi:hypothetical protein
MVPEDIHFSVKNQKLETADYIQKMSWKND